MCVCVCVSGHGTPCPAPGGVRSGGAALAHGQGEGEAAHRSTATPQSRRAASDSRPATTRRGSQLAPSCMTSAVCAREPGTWRAGGPAQGGGRSAEAGNHSGGHALLEHAGDHGLHVLRRDHADLEQAAWGDAVADAMGGSGRDSPRGGRGPRRRRLLVCPAAARAKQPRTEPEHEGCLVSSPVVNARLVAECVAEIRREFHDGAVEVLGQDPTHDVLGALRNARGGRVRARGGLPFAAARQQPAFCAWSPLVPRTPPPARASRARPTVAGATI